MDQGGAAYACGLRPFTAAPALGCLHESQSICLRRGPHDSGMTGPNRPAYWVGGRGASSRLPFSPVRTYQEPPEGQDRSSSGRSIAAPLASPDRATRGLNGRREDTRTTAAAGPTPPNHPSPQSAKGRLVRIAGQCVPASWWLAGRWSYSSRSRERCAWQPTRQPGSGR